MPRRRREPLAIHTIFTEHREHTAICEVCRKKNTHIYYRCPLCTTHVCTPCLEGRLGSDASHTYSAGLGVTWMNYTPKNGNQLNVGSQSNSKEGEEVVLGAKDSEIEKLDDVERQRGISRTRTTRARGQKRTMIEHNGEGHLDTSSGKSSEPKSKSRQRRQRAVDDEEHRDNIFDEKPNKQMSKTRQQKRRMVEEESDDDMSNERPSKQTRKSEQQMKRASNRQSNKEALVTVNSRRENVEKPQEKRKVQPTEQLPRVSRDIRGGREAGAAAKAAGDGGITTDYALADYLLRLGSATQAPVSRTRETNQDASGISLLLDAAHALYEAATMSAEDESPRINPVSIRHIDEQSAETVRDRDPDMDMDESEPMHPTSFLVGAVTTTAFPVTHTKQGEASRTGRLAKAIASSDEDSGIEGKGAARHQTPLFFDYEPAPSAADHSRTGLIPIDTRTAVNEATATTTDTASDELVEAELTINPGNAGHAAGSERLKALYRDALLVKTFNGHLKPLRL